MKQLDSKELANASGGRGIYYLEGLGWTVVEWKPSWEMTSDSCAINWNHSFALDMSLKPNDFDFHKVFG